MNEQKMKWTQNSDALKKKIFAILRLKLLWRASFWRITMFFLDDLKFGSLNKNRSSWNGISSNCCQIWFLFQCRIYTLRKALFIVGAAAREHNIGSLQSRTQTNSMRRKRRGKRWKKKKTNLRMLKRFARQKKGTISMALLLNKERKRGLEKKKRKENG